MPRFNVYGEIEHPDPMILNETFVDSVWNSEHLRIRKWMEQNRRNIDSLEIPVNVFDAFLVVIDPNQIETIAPQFARANIKTLVLGDENWANREMLQKVRTYIDGIIFPEPFNVSGGEDYYDFASKLPNINKYHLSGERAAQILAFAMQGASNKEQLRLNLSLIRELETLSGTVTILKEERVDRTVPLIQYRFNNFEVIHIEK